LRCEYRENPLGIDATSPRLSWILASNINGQTQTGYQILVASDPQKLAMNAGDLWDTGQVASANSIQIPYGGKPLQTGQQCFWKVRVWDTDGKPSDWTAVSQWTMGVLNPQDWQATWIGRGDEPTKADLTNAKWIWPKENAGAQVSAPAAQTSPSQTTQPSAVVMFRKSFTVPSGAEVQSWFVLGATDMATVFVDGRRVGDVTDPHRAQVFDLTPAPAGTHSLWVLATKNSQQNGMLGAIVQSSPGKDPQIISTDESWESTLDAGNPDAAWGTSQAVDIQTDSKTWAVQGPQLPMLRKEFPLRQVPKRAVVYLCGLGQFELHVNGRVASEDLLQPGWTDYRKTCLYVGYDITPLLKVGNNVIGVMLGNGMFNVTPGRYIKFKGSMGSPQVIGQLSLDYSDGHTEQIATDGSWKVSAGPIMFSSIYGGEDYDARLEQSGWDQAGFDDSQWAEALPMKGPGGDLRGSTRSAPPIRVAQIFKPVKIIPLADGDNIYDMGQNCAMIPAITVSGPEGATVRLTPGEVLNDDGTLNTHSGKNGVWVDYTLHGGGQETWSPRFWYFGCRYIQVHGAVAAGAAHDDKTPELLDLQGRFITSAAPAAGQFACSNDLFNRTAALIEWAIRSNSVSIMTDCPHREKLGWLEQDNLMGPSLLYSHDMGALFGKISGDMRDAQHDDGLEPDIAPEYDHFAGGFVDSPEWGSSCVLVPWSTYQWYGDKRVLAESYDMMKRYADYLGTRAKDNIVDYGLGDWFDLGPKRPGKAQLTPVALTATAYYYEDLQVVSQAARVLGKSDDAQKYQDLAGAVADSFNKNFYHPDDFSYATGSQAANAIAVAWKLAAPEDVPEIIVNIVANMRKNGNAQTGGDVGYRYILQALADHEQNEEIFKVNNQSDKPGYGYQLAHGATSLTESWTASPMLSNDHFMLGHLLEWFYRDLAGIQPVDGSVGFARVRIKPAMVGDITWTKATYDSIRGPIVSDWTRDGKKIVMDVEIPPGVKADVFVPADSREAVTAPAAGATFERMEGPAAVFAVGSGKYEFSVQ
jgi:hypothetical protein